MRDERRRSVYEVARRAKRGDSKRGIARDLGATRLHDELAALGFDGGDTIVREYLNGVRPKGPHFRTDPKAVKRSRRLVETAPGVQAQVDWGVFALADGTPVCAFSCVMSYSRAQCFRFCTDTRQPTILRQMRAAFEFLGGVAGEYVFDSMPGIVDRWEMDAPALNLRAVDFVW